MRAAVLTKLRAVMPDITASEVYRVALWLLGQYSLSDEEVRGARNGCTRLRSAGYAWSCVCVRVCGTAAGERACATPRAIPPFPPRR